MFCMEKIYLDKNVIPYRKRFNKITGNPKASILLQQMIYWAKILRWRKFYKFIEPCTHILYKPGDSWTEQLGFSVSEFQTALKRISTKITTGVKKSEILKREDAKSLIIYWTDSSRTTWYQINLPLLDKLLKNAYLEDNKTEDSFNRDYPKTTDINNHSSNDEYFNNLLNNNQTDFKSSSDLLSDSLSIQEVIDYYYESYEMYRGDSHPFLKQAQIKRVEIVLQEFSRENRFSLEEWEMMIDHWFNGGVKSNKTDFNINHFANNGILKVLNHKTPR